MSERSDDPEDTRQTSRSGVPAEGAVVRDRFSSDEIFQRIIAAADEEITAGRRELFFAGVAGGLAITITVLVYASLWATTGDSPTEPDRVVASLLYPIGFIYIILGGYQLYTENTLPPVALTLERLATGSLRFNVVNQVDCSVVLAERPHERSVLDRLFG